MNFQTPCYIFDIDGTLANLDHRLHFIKSCPKDWPAFKRACIGDTPIWHMIDLAKRLHMAQYVTAGKPYEIVLVSGRNEEQRTQTETWLKQYDVPYAALFMRADGDFRDDSIIKAELLAEVRKAGFEPVMVFDDRTRVVNMWRANRIPCAQVAMGDF